MRVKFPASKRARFLDVTDMEYQHAQTLLAAARERYGRDIRVFETSAAASSTPANASSSDDVADDFYEFTAEDYYRLMASKKEDKYLKTKKIRDAEENARRSKVPTRVTMRVRFPDNHTVEASFHSSETIQSLVDLVSKVVAHPEVPFHLYTAPPKKRLNDLSLDFYSAGFVPGAIVYFATNGGGEQSVGPFLREDVMLLKGLAAAETGPEPEPREPAPSQALPPPTSSSSPSDKKKMKPKWLKM